MNSEDDPGRSLTVRRACRLRRCLPRTQNARSCAQAPGPQAGSCSRSLGSSQGCSRRGPPPARLSNPTHSALNAATRDERWPGVHYQAARPLSREIRRTLSGSKCRSVAGPVISSVGCTPGSCSTWVAVMRALRVDAPKRTSCCTKGNGSSNAEARW
jgi:hypothetical protein